MSTLFSDRLSAVGPYFSGVGFMSTICSLGIHFAGCKCWARYLIWPFRNLNMYILVIVP